MRQELLAANAEKLALSEQLEVATQLASELEAAKVEVSQQTQQNLRRLKPNNSLYQSSWR
jgi:hypothetical protein